MASIITTRTAAANISTTFGMAQFPRSLAPELSVRLTARHAYEGCGANEVSRWLCWSPERENSAVDKLERLKELFVGRHFDREVILLCVRWYLRFKLSLRDLVEMMAERGLSLAHTTIMRWVQHYTPEFEKRWHRYAVAVGRSWRVDETYVKIRGVWHYLYRAVGAGQSISG
jgi:DDE domain